ncbi:MAG TPA: histidine kinase dimerization/phospho-acceptor domain-containing protein, partial [Tepidiformaceae bacterium]|nr:histidine kinase dimerization/phospho-acceptor domain-containing protein [Tepidiformaceae bacterium]
MFERARIVLTASYAAALVATLAGIGTVVYVLIRNDLNEEIDDSLRLASSQLEGFIVSEVRPEFDRDRGDDDHEEDEHEGDRLTVLSSDVFYLAFNTSGAVLFNPRGVNVEGIDLAGAARDSADEPIQHVSGDDADYRVAIRPLGEGTYLAVGRSLHLVQHQLETLRMVFLYGGLIGLGASIAIGFWLAGRTLGPIRLALESQRRFVSDASHELRTPLAVAKANSALILDDPEGSIESHLDQAEAVATELDHLTVLVGDL